MKLDDDTKLIGHNSFSNQTIVFELRKDLDTLHFDSNHENFLIFYSHKLTWKADFSDFGAIGLTDTTEIKTWFAEEFVQKHYVPKLNASSTESFIDPPFVNFSTNFSLKSSTYATIPIHFDLRPVYYIGKSQEKLEFNSSLTYSYFPEAVPCKTSYSSFYPKGIRIEYNSTLSTYQVLNMPYVNLTQTYDFYVVTDVHGYGKFYKPFYFLLDK